MLLMVAVESSLTVSCSEWLPAFVEVTVPLSEGCLSVGVTVSVVEKIVSCSKDGLSVLKMFRSCCEGFTSVEISG